MFGPGPVLVLRLPRMEPPTGSMVELTRRFRRRALVGFLAIIGALLMLVSLTTAAPPDHPVISQVYGGGGNGSAVYTHDFIELFNPSPVPVSLDGWSVQYASATGAGSFGIDADQLTPLSGILQPGQYLLIRGAEGAGGTTPLPPADITDATPISIRATGAKIALVRSATSLFCNGANFPCSPAQMALIVDLVGWGEANAFEVAPGPATNNTLALFRRGQGCIDIGNNAADFVTGPPAPRNRASSPRSCTLSLGLFLDRHTISAGETVHLSMSVANALPGERADLYLVVALPVALSIGCPVPPALVFIGNGGSTIKSACLSDAASTFPPYAANSPLESVVASVLSLTWPASAPPVPYVFALVATPPGALADGVLGPDDILAIVTDQVILRP